MAHRRNEVVRRVGQRLRDLREAKGQTQEQIAERAGYTGKYVSEIERGLRDPPLTTLERLAVRGFGCQLHELVATAPAKPNPVEDYRRGGVPRDLRAIVNDLAGLPPHVQRRVIALVRGLIALARSGREPLRP